MRRSTLNAIVSLLALLVASGAGAARAGNDALPQVAAGGKLPFVAVLVWHDVLPAKDVWFDTTTATFSDQLAQIKRGGFHVVPLAALRAHLVDGAPLPAKPLVLTFDDNGHGIYRNAYPLLQRYRYPATLFVHTNFVGKTTSKAHNSWDELREMERSGLIDVQSLTANHPPDLTKLGDADVVHELRLSAFSLERRLGRKIYALVYPYDVYDERIERLAARNGYALAFSEDFGNAGESTSLLAIHRYSILARFAQALGDVAAGAR